MCSLAPNSPGIAPSDIACQSPSVLASTEARTRAPDADGAGLIDRELVGDGRGPPTLDRSPGENRKNAPPIASMPTMAAAATRAGVVIVGNLHGIRRSRSCDVVWIRRRAASTA